jgi:hypothetical protein
MRAIQPTHRRRGVLAGLIAGSLLAWSLLGSGAALAATPNWFAGLGTDRTAVPQPTTGQSSTSVAAGKNVGFYTWLWNDGTSNISQLYITATFDGTSAGATFVVKNAAGTVVGSGACAPATALDCSVGPLNAGNTVYVTSAFTTKSTAADGAIVPVSFEYNTTGTPPGKNNSHGDALDLADSIQISKNGDASGDFNLNNPAGLNIADDQKVSPQNPQATSANVASNVQLGIGGSVAEIAGTSSFCDTTILVNPQPWFSCSLLTSQISTVQIANGKNLNNPNVAPSPGTPGIQVKILFKKAPSQLSGSQPFVYHRWTDSSGADHAELVFNPCHYTNGFPDQSGPCLTVSNNAVTVWLIHNGGMRS